MEADPLKPEYPTIKNRVLALMIDNFIIIALALALSFILGALEMDKVTSRKIAFLCAFILYEPLLVSLTGGTIGHAFQGIKVKRHKTPSKNLYFHMALLRYFIKSVLGWITLIVIGLNDEKRAVHDLASGAILLFR